MEKKALKAAKIKKVGLNPLQDRSVETLWCRYNWFSASFETTKLPFKLGAFIKGQSSFSTFPSMMLTYVHVLRSGMVCYLLRIHTVVPCR